MRAAAPARAGSRYVLCAAIKTVAACLLLRSTRVFTRLLCSARSPVRVGVPRQNFGLAAPDVQLPPAAFPPSAPAPSSAYPSPAAPPAAPLQPPPGAAAYPAYPAPGVPQQPASPPGYAAQAPPQPPPQAASQPSAGPAAGAGAPTHAQKEAAKKAAKQAISALNFDDVASAVDALRAALRSLGVP